MNEQQIQIQLQDVKHRIIQLTNEVEKQKKINQEIRKRFDILADEIKRIKDHFGI